MEHVSELLAKAIADSLQSDGREFHWETFFPIWFRKFGTPCFFLFKRNLGVTNAQYIELLSLLETHCVDVETQEPKRQLLFHTTEQLKATSTDVINSLLDVKPEERESQIRRFSDTYREVYASTVALDMFYSSCAVFLPPNLSLDIRQICSDAGYIHSAGWPLYIRNIKKARREDLIRSLDARLETIPSEQQPIPFVVYAHEDFSGYDSEAREEINRGIDGTKIYLEKMNMGSYRLSEIVQEMKSSYKGKLEIPEAGSYKTEHHFFRPETIWLIGDRSVAPINPMNPGIDRYYICYQQCAKSEDPFFLFDENKPAWKSHTTLPHSLTAALVNATRPHLKSAKLCDPFGGTGTTWLEAKRLRLPVAILCSDASPIIGLLVRDNLEFFLMDNEGLNSQLRRFQSLREHLKTEATSVSSEQRELTLETPSQAQIITEPYFQAKALLEELRKEQPSEDQEFRFSDAFVARLSALPMSSRLVFYIALRAELRYQGGFKRRATTFDKAFHKSIDELTTQVQKLVDLRKSVAQAETELHGNYITFPGTYSPVVVPSLIVEKFEGFEAILREEVLTKDARDLEKDSLDAIICDPPYGFNTSEDRRQLATLYSEFLDSAISALRDQGHLIICLPAESYTGRDLPYCTYARLVSNQILLKARKLGKQAVLPARSLPHRMLVPPYYWEADRALRRTILHFRIATLSVSV